MTIRRVVLDTDTVIMPIIRGPRSNDSWMVSAWTTKRIIPYTTEETELELLETLKKPKLGLKDEEILSIAAIYLDHCVKVEIEQPPNDVPQCLDESDQKFLVLAHYIEADALVSRDRRLLELRDESRIPILNRGDFTLVLRHP